MKLFVRAIAVLFTLAGGASAQSSSALTPLDTREASKGWEAIGRLDIAGAGFCTATLVRDNLILTAAHCVYDRDASLIALDRFDFQAGLRDGQTRASRKIARVIPHPDYEQNAEEWTLDRMAADLALLELAQPIRFAGIFPLPLSPDAYPGDQVSIVSYGGSRADFPSLQENCHLMDRSGGILVMDCAAERGTSGAPVLRVVAGLPRVVGVVAAIADMGADPISLAVPMQAQLQALNDMMEHLSAIPPAAAPMRNDTGAKFVRP